MFIPIYIYVYIYIYIYIYLYATHIHDVDTPLLAAPDTQGGSLSRRWISVAAAAGARFLAWQPEFQMGDRDPKHGGNPQKHENQWVDLREDLQETIDFPMNNGMFL